jgi:hypothetical protein
MSNERIEQLERSVKRWRLVSLVLALLLICAVAIGGIFAVVPATHARGEFWLWLPWVRERAAREDAMRARLQAEKALQELEAAKLAEDEAKKNGR